MEDKTQESHISNEIDMSSDKPGRDKKTRPVTWFLLIIILLSPWFFYKYLWLPPSDFPVDEMITVPAGATLKDVSKIMKDNNLIRSEFVFFTYFSLSHDTTTLKASNYFFTEPLALDKLAVKLTEGNYTEGLIKFTHIEGESVDEVATRAEDVLADFDKDKFIELAKPHEGRLFPDTYMIPDTFNEEELLDLFRETFTEKISPLQDQIDEHDLSLENIIILSSLLERETNEEENRRIVSGILQNRLAINMPLQVDASLEYVLDKHLSELTPEDLKKESPYNTYLNVGLPPTPIGNPGLDTIKAVLSPIETEYMFYITGDDGNFYYAKDFDEHRSNISKYLR